MLLPTRLSGPSMRKGERLRVMRLTAGSGCLGPTSQPPGKRFRIGGRCRSTVVSNERQSAPIVLKARDMAS
jgi:hypothetical protein